MELRIEQQKKDLFEAKFNIIEKEKIVGNIQINGIIFSMEANVDINYKGETITLNPTKRKEVVQKTKGLIKSSFFNNSHNRPYNTFINDKNGFIFSQCGSKALDFYDFQRYDKDDYYMYVIGFGEKGICAPIYKDNSCIGELHKECVCKDDLHIFDLIIENDVDIIPSIIFTVYYYLTSYYKAGEKVIIGTKKILVTTTEKERIKLCKNPYYFEQ